MKRMRPTKLIDHASAALLAALLITACAVAPTPPARTPTIGSPTASPVRTAEVVVRRNTTGLPTRGPASPELPQTTAREAAALIVQAVTLLLTESVDQAGSAILYGAAYDGAVATLRRLGYTVEGGPPPFADDDTDAGRFADAYLRLAAAPAVVVNQTSLAYEAIRAAAARLDECNTALLSPREYATIRDGDGASDSYGGLGLTLRPGASPPTIATVYPDSPAARLGLRPGDPIAAIDGTATTGLTPAQIGGALRGSVGTAVTLTIGRPGARDSRTVVLIREAIRPPALTATVLLDSAGRSIGLLRVNTLAPESARELDRALATFAEADVAGLIIDLREASGDSTETLAALAGRFLTGGQPVAYRVRRSQEEPLVVTDARSGTQLPLAALLNGGTTGTAELLAAALADTGRARLFGEPTAGCVSASALFPLADGAALRIGTARLQSPARRDLTKAGQQPDEIAWSRPAAASDPPLVVALAWLAAQHR